MTVCREQGLSDGMSARRTVGDDVTTGGGGVVVMMCGLGVIGGSGGGDRCWC